MKSIYSHPHYQTSYYVYQENMQLAYRLAPNYTCEIVDIVATPHNKGLGTMLYQKFEQDIKNLYQVKNLYAFTRSTNDLAVKWYKKMGFSATLIPNYYFDEPENKAWILTKNLF